MPHAVNDNETQLLTLAASGNRQAFAALYTAYVAELHQYIFLFTHSKQETEEIVQEVFVKLWENRSKLESISSFKHYLFRSAKNKLLDEVRKQQIRHRVLNELKRSAAIGERSTDNQVAYKEYYRIVQEAIEQLPPKRKLIFRLNTENGLSHDEIAHQLHISKPVVKKQLYLAYSFVKDYLKRHGGLSYSTITLLAIIGG
jgi:RNA polymerase sigma-70 factor (family 1)